MTHFKLFFFILFSYYGIAQETQKSCKSPTPSNCNYITNGDFNSNDGSPVGDNSVNDYVCNWFADRSTGTPDYFFNGSYPTVATNIANSGSENAYIGYSSSKEMVNGDPLYYTELPYTLLNTPLLPNTTYRLSFQVLRRVENVFGGDFEMQACFVNQTNTTSPTPIPMDINTGNLIFPAGSIFLDNNVLVDNTTAWKQIVFTFTTGSTAGQNFLYLGPLVDPMWVADPSNQDPWFTMAYSFIDNVSLAPVFNPVFTMPNTICSNDSNFNLNGLLTGETASGFFTIDGTPISGTTFNATTVGLGNHTITYTIPETIACEKIVVSSTIVVTACEEILFSPYISQVYKGLIKDRMVEIKNPSTTSAILLNQYYLVLFANGSTTPTAYIDVASGGNITSNGVKVFKGVSTFSPSYAASTATLFNGFQFFDGENDLLILSTSYGSKAYKDRIDIIGDNTSNSIFYKDYTLEGYKSLVRMSCTPMGFPRNEYDEQDWVGFNRIAYTSSGIVYDDFEVDNQFSKTNGVLGRHYSDELRWNGSWNDLGITNPADESNPDRSRYEVINKPYNTNTSGSFEACSLVVNFDLDITPSTYVKVQTNVDVNTSVGTQILNVHDGGSLVMARDCFYNVCGANLSSSGMSLKRKTNALSGPNDYVYWSSPLSSSLSNPTAGQIFNFGGGTGPLFGMHRFYSFENQNYCDIYRKFNVAQPLETDGYDDDLNDYLSFTHPFNANAANQQLIPGRGYNTWPPVPTIPGNYNYQIDFKGEMNNGVVTVHVYKNNSEKGKNSNLVGNPYPSAIDLDRFFQINAAVIEPIAYIWSRLSDDPNAIPGPNGLNYSAGNYTVYTTDFVLNDQENSNFEGYNILSSGQSFFVRTYKNFDGFTNDYVSPLTVASNISPANHPHEQIISAGGLVFSNIMRTTAPNITFSKTSNLIAYNKNDLSDKLWLNLTDANNFTVQLGVGFKSKGSANYVQGEDFTTIDGRKYDFYTQSTPVDLMIDIQDSFSIDKIIPLGIINSSENLNQSFSISIPKKSGIFNKQEVYLFDSLLNIYHDLSKSGYSFTTTGSLIENRFSLRFAQNNSSLVENNANNQLVASIANETLSLQSLDKNIKSVWVYDLYTKDSDLVVEQANINSKIANLPVGKNQKLLSVKIELEDGTIVIKKMGK